MKNREQLIIDASDVIAEFKKTCSTGFDLFFYDEKFYCSPKCMAEEMQHFIRHFSTTQAEKGLTSPQWLRVGNKAVKLMEGSAQ